MDKAPDAFRTISEVAEQLDVPQHVLRFWESRFPQIRPMKRGGGRRYYRPDDVDLLRGIRHLLYGEGYTIRGVQRILRDQGIGFVQSVWQAGAEQPMRNPGDDDEDPAAVAPELSVPAKPESGRPLLGLSPSLLDRVADPEPRMTERREPTLMPPSAVVPVIAPGLAHEQLRKLKDALDHLAECRRLLDAALETRG